MQGNEQKSSGLGNQTSISVKRKGRPPKSQVKIAQAFPAGNMCFNLFFIGEKGQFQSANVQNAFQVRRLIEFRMLKELQKRSIQQIMLTWIWL